MTKAECWLMGYRDGRWSRGCVPTASVLFLSEYLRGYGAGVQSRSTALSGRLAKHNEGSV